jgi:hypothetical protein
MPRPLRLVHPGKNGHNGELKKLRITTARTGTAKEKATEGKEKDTIKDY